MQRIKYKSPDGSSQTLSEVCVCGSDGRVCVGLIAICCLSLCSFVFAHFVRTRTRFIILVMVRLKNGLISVS